jgi:hypothetical protein
MARTIAAIQQSIIDAKNADATLAGLSSTSNTALWRLWTYIVAVGAWVNENLFDAHKAEVTGIIAAELPHNLQWYATKAVAFQLGYTLRYGKDVYDTIDATAHIVTNAVAVELPNRVRLKAAKTVGGVLAPLSAGELTAFSSYMQRVKDGGVRLQCTSGAADTLRVALTVYYDPLVLDSEGRRLDGTSDTPVQDAINAFASALPFNGVFILNKLIAAIQAVDGVVIGEVDYCAARYGALPFAEISAAYTPDAGYLVLDGDYFTTNTIYTAYGV